MINLVKEKTEQPYWFRLLKNAMAEAKKEESTGGSK